MVQQKTISKIEIKKFITQRSWGKYTIHLEGPCFLLLWAVAYTYVESSASFPPQSVSAKRNNQILPEPQSTAHFEQFESLV